MEKSNGDYERIRKLMKEQNSKEYNKPYILRNLHEKPNLRKTYLAVVKNSPARISEVFESALLTKPTCYSQLYKLLEMGLIGRVFVMDVMGGTIKNNEIKKKFQIWVKSMPEQLKRYYLAKTSFWVITNFGKEFASRAWDFEQEFRKSEEQNIEVSKV